MRWTFSKEKLRNTIAGVLFPENNACHLCGRCSERPGILCTSCQEALNALRYKKLRIADSEPRPPLEVCMAAYPHRAEARDLVHLFKYQSDCIAAQLLGEGMAAALVLSPLRPERVDAVVPVPLHAARLEQRGYNQALLLAQALCSHAQFPLLEGALIRLHSTDTQTHLDREERLKAMQHAFAVPDVKLVQGKQILLVDDVLTTGATAMSCAQALMEAGSAGVSLLTACRA